MKKLLVLAAAIFLAAAHPILHSQDTSQSATSATANNGINGNWHFVLETPGGDRDVNAQFTVDTDGNVTGKWGSADVAGTYKEGQLALKFQFTSEEAGTTADMKLDGKLDEAGAIAGDWAFSEYNGTFKASRPQDSPTPAPAGSTQPQ